MYPSIRASDLIPYGRIRKAHGYQGAVVITLESEYVYSLEPEFLFIAIDEIPVPFRVEDMRGSQDQWIVSFQGVQNLEKSEQLVGLQVFVHREEQPHEEHHHLPLSSHFLCGFMLRHVNGMEVGHITHLDDSTANLLMTIQGDDHKLLIPLVEEWVIGLDEHNRSITLDFPLELLEL